MTYSWAGRLFAAASVLSVYKKIYSNEKALSAYIDYRQKRNDEPCRAPLIFRNAYGMQKRFAHGMEIFECKGTGGSEITLLYLHGSGFVMQPTLFHWRFFGRLAKKTQARTFMPIYPKAPGHRFDEAITRLADFYEELLERTKPDRIAFVGDSSGGAVVLALAQEVVRRGLPVPRRLLLISPMLDSTLGEPGIEALERKDLLQTKKVLRSFAEAWSGGENTAHPGVSPFFGRLDSLPPISMFIGTHDILLPGSRAFAAKLKAENGTIEPFEYERMIHDFALLPIPEAKHVMSEIRSALGEKEADEKP